MSNRLEAYAHLAAQTLRTGYYAALYRISNRCAAQLGAGGAGLRTRYAVARYWFSLDANFLCPHLPSV